MTSHIIASHSVLKEGQSAETVCKKVLKRVSFGSLDDLRSFAELQNAVTCTRCKKAEDPMMTLYYGGSEGAETR